jgi:hypothetical protein
MTGEGPVNAVTMVMRHLQREHRTQLIAPKIALFQWIQAVLRGGTYDLWYM